MAGFKRGGFRGGGGASKKSFAKKRTASDDEDGTPRAGKKTKGDDEDTEDATPIVPELKTNEDGEKFISGISLNLDQYNTLVAAMPLIEAALAEKNATVARPDYDSAPAAPSDPKGEDAEAKAGEEEEAEKAE
ncbi:hypothetical protein ACEQ8H_001215 [Pleosporales sp. CAS-2024a]